MRRQSSIILFCLMMRVAYGQLSQETPKAVISGGIDSAITSHGFDPKVTSIVADSLWRHLVTERSFLTATAVCYISHIEITRVGFADRQFVIYGWMTSLHPAKPPEGFSFMVQLGAPPGPEIREEVLLPPDEPGFWDSVLQPTLVTLGAVAIITLFFLIRS